MSGVKTAKSWLSKSFPKPWMKTPAPIMLKKLMPVMAVPATCDGISSLMWAYMIWPKELPNPIMKKMRLNHKTLLCRYRGNAKNPHARIPSPKMTIFFGNRLFYQIRNH